MSFRQSWLLAAVVLVILAVGAGLFVSRIRRFYAILIDDRDRFSLNRFQLVVWTILILSTFLSLLFTNLEDPGKAMAIPTELLGLIGISIGTGVVAGAVKAGKTELRATRIGGGPAFVASLSLPQQALVPSSEPPHFGQVILEEEGVGANRVINVTKFQNFIFTCALGVVYVVLTWKANGYPALDEKTIWLIGVSHAGYVGGKMPNKA